jgi:NAD(P)-dependent dehydrogenase (short-subunit alcohol dehydrogenase family)
MSSETLAGKVALITGAGGGLGRSFALAFANAGALVVAADINEAGAQETAELIGAVGGKAVGAKVDVTNAASLAALVDTTIQFGGRIDCLVNNAAIYAGLKRQSFLDIPEAEWDRVMAVNVKGAWMATKAVAPVMKAQKSGTIVNISSATVMSGSPQWLHYVSSKGAIIAMTRALARELGDDDITVNAIAPGFTLTEASLGLMDNAAEYGVTRGALKRASSPEDMVGAALFLASPSAAFITGQTLIVDGGRQFL